MATKHDKWSDAARAGYRVYQAKQFIDGGLAAGFGQATVALKDFFVHLLATAIVVGVVLAMGYWG